MHRRNQTWLIGGVGLIGCAVAGMLQSAMAATPGASAVKIVADLCWGAAIVVFAIGLSPAESVVARKPFGVTAMVVLALWPISTTLLWMLLDPGQSPGAGWIVLGYLSILVPVAAALVAAVQIARAGTVPNRWRWAPLWVLAAQAIVWALPQAVAVGTDTSGIQAMVGLLTLLGMLGFLAGTLGLGVLALVLATTHHASSVQVYPST
ncbi:hypothetical protein [uncultured Microbacterium sp.]|uniref:hypothetical protein n=1 Tax=uncultured Microbacterium sp. TaxID=191216 RepID=UPI0035CA7BD7